MEAVIEKKEEAKEQKQYILRCPVCNTMGSVFFGCNDMNGYKTKWVICKCGCVFNTEPVSDLSNFYTASYRELLARKKSTERRYDYIRRVYVPLIEEASYGRRFLDVGYCLPYHIDAMRERGWLAEGIDRIENQYITGDFLTHDFGLKKYDFIFMGHILQCFDDPLKALKKAYDLLNLNGILLVITPDAELIFWTGYMYWGHWNSKEHRVYWAERKLKEEAERIGFNTVLSRKNFSKRFISWNEAHCIFQKPSVPNPEAFRKEKAVI